MDVGGVPAAAARDGDLRHPLRHPLVEARQRVEGVSARYILEQARPRPEAKWVLQHAGPDYTTNTALEDLRDEDVLLALKHNGRDIDPDHGGPMRLVLPKLYFWKSSKWLRAFELLEVNPPASASRTGTTCTRTRGPRNATPTRRRGRCSRCARKLRAGRESASSPPLPVAPRIAAWARRAQGGVPIPRGGRPIRGRLGWAPSGWGACGIARRERVRGPRPGPASPTPLCAERAPDRGQTLTPPVCGRVRRASEASPGPPASAASLCFLNPSPHSAPSLRIPLRSRLGDDRRASEAG